MSETHGIRRADGKFARLEKKFMSGDIANAWIAASAQSGAPASVIRVAQLIQTFGKAERLVRSDGASGRKPPLSQKKIVIDPAGWTISDWAPSEHGANLFSEARLANRAYEQAKAWIELAKIGSQAKKDAAAHGLDLPGLRVVLGAAAQQAGSFACVKAAPAGGLDPVGSLSAFVVAVAGGGDSVRFLTPMELRTPDLGRAKFFPDANSAKEWGVKKTDHQTGMGVLSVRLAFESFEPVRDHADFDAVFGRLCAHKEQMEIQAEIDKKPSEPAAESKAPKRGRSRL